MLLALSSIEEGAQGACTTNLRTRCSWHGDCKPDNEWKPDFWTYVHQIKGFCLFLQVPLSMQAYDITIERTMKNRLCLDTRRPAGLASPENLYCGNNQALPTFTAQVTISKHFYCDLKPSISLETPKSSHNPKVYILGRIFSGLVGRLSMEDSLHHMPRDAQLVRRILLHCDENV